MKKIIISILVLASCVANNFAQTSELKNETDSLSYAFAVLQSNRISAQVLNNETEGVNYDAFMKGLNKGFASEDSTDEKYVIGLQVGLSIKQGFLNDTSLRMNVGILHEAIVSALSQKELKMTEEEAVAFLDLFLYKKNAEKYGYNKLAGEKFLEENKTKPDVVTTESGLQYKIVKKGKKNGAIPTETDMVQVRYKGTFIDGTEFGSGTEMFPVKGVIQGFSEALQLMPLGSKWIVYVPQELGYGAMENPMVKPFSTLIFEIELLGVNVE
jgi:FKBP-type peptidyl-prolyl cis-trans isomerase FklB